MSTDQKHEEEVEFMGKVAEKMGELTGFLKDTQERIGDIVESTNKLMSGYDPQPELKKLAKGDWVKTYQQSLVLYVSDKDENSKNVLYLNGKKGFYGNRIISSKPHIFTEPDLELLNTDEVTYELNKGRSFYYVSGKRKGDRFEHFREFPTEHEAIESVFTATVKTREFDKRYDLESEGTDD